MNSETVGPVTDNSGSGHEFAPKRRFPEFREAGAWVPTPLQDLCDPINEKVGNAKLTPVSITAGRGFVSQASKFGRDISGVQYRNYTYLRQGDFAYNKGNSLSYPQGWVCQLKEFEEAAASSAFICFRLHDKYRAAYFQALFDQNVHGRQLTSFITSGARSNGLLNIRTEDFYGVKIPLPPESAEQDKIADCLSSLDELIAAEMDRLAALRDYKKGLMQQLFPRPARIENGEQLPAETVPRLRFPEFVGAGEWEERSIGDSSTSFSGGTPSTSNAKFYGGSIPFIRSAEIELTTTELHLTDEGLSGSSAKLVAIGDVLIAMYGANSGNAAISKISGAINQAILCVRHETNNQFFYHFWNSRQDWVNRRYLQGGQGNLSADIIKSIQIPTPADEKEQQQIAKFLATIDSVIELQDNKVKELKAHKVGLIQQLFPLPIEANA